MPVVLFVFECLFAVVCLAMSSGYVFLAQHNQNRLSFLAKCLASFLFLLIGGINAVGCKDNIFAVTILTALFMGFAGDAFMGAPKFFKGRFAVYFVCSMVSFGLGHILYFVGILGLNGGISLWCILYGVLLYGLVILVTWKAAKKADTMRIPGMVYMFLVCSVAGIAFGKAIAEPCAYTILFAVGGFLFALSDTILILQTLGKKKRKAMNYGIALTYYSAQVLIGFSLMFVGIT